MNLRRNTRTRIIGRPTVGIVGMLANAAVDPRKKITYEVVYPESGFSFST